MESLNRVAETRPASENNTSDVCSFDTWEQKNIHIFLLDFCFEQRVARRAKIIFISFRILFDRRRFQTNYTLSLQIVILYPQEYDELDEFII